MVGVLTSCVSLAIGGVSALQGDVKPLGCKADVLMVWAGPGTSREPAPGVTVVSPC